MKKLLVVLILAGLAYGTWKYLEKIKERTAARSENLKPGEKALR